MTADPRYAGRGNERSGGDVLLDAGHVRKVLESMMVLEEPEMTVWLTTKEMGSALAAEVDELIEERGVREGRRTGRWIAPQIEAFIVELESGRHITREAGGEEDATLQEELSTMLADLCNPHEDGKLEDGEKVRNLVLRWESASEPLMAKEPSSSCLAPSSSSSLAVHVSSCQHSLHLSDPGHPRHFSLPTFRERGCVGFALGGVTPNPTVIPNG